MKVEMDFDQKKFFLVIILTCILFFILVMNALDSAESQKIEQTKASQNIDTVNEKQEVNNITENNTTDTQNTQETNNKKTIVDNKIVIKNEETGEYEIFDKLEPNTTKNNLETIELKNSKNTENNPEHLLDTAKELIKEKQFVKAIDLLITIPNKTDNKNLVASSYEEIAIIYASAKKYETALNYAQKAFNTSPSNSREILLARLYYKAGDRDKAITRMNNVLQRDFVINATK